MLIIKEARLIKLYILSEFGSRTIKWNLSFDRFQIVDTPNSKSTKETPKTMSGSKSRKRKRLRENLAQLAADTDQDSPMCTNKRRSKELARMSLSASYLEVTDLSLKSPGRWRLVQSENVVFANLFIESSVILNTYSVRSYVKPLFSYVLRFLEIVQNIMLFLWIVISSRYIPINHWYLINNNK